MAVSEQREIRLEVKKTRVGKLLTFADVDAKAGIRSMTDAELKAHDFIENLTENFDTDQVDPGKVGVVRVTECSEPEVEWCSDAAADAAQSDSNSQIPGDRDE